MFSISALPLLQPYPSMLLPHMIVHVVAGREALDTDPTHMRTTGGTHHVVASRNFFDARLAIRARLDVVGCAPAVERLLDLALVVARQVVLAGDAFVLLDVTVRADMGETKAALDGSVGWAHAIDVLAVRSWAVSILVGMRSDVCLERGVEEGVLVGERCMKSDH